MSDEERERLNHPDRFKTDDFVYEVKPDGELETHAQPLGGGSDRGCPHQGFRGNGRGEGGKEESETIGNMNAEYEVSLPKPLTPRSTFF